MDFLLQWILKSENNTSDFRRMQRSWSDFCIFTSRKTSSGPFVHLHLFAVTWNGARRQDQNRDSFLLSQQSVLSRLLLALDQTQLKLSNSSQSRSVNISFMQWITFMACDNSDNYRYDEQGTYKPPLTLFTSSHFSLQGDLQIKSR